MQKKTVVLIVLDGWGIGKKDQSNPIHVADPPTFRELAKEFPTGSLQASGIGVGLPWGEVGNSEVGHLTMGAGKVIYQYFPRITLSIRDKTFFDNPTLKAACDHAKKNNSALHLAGLLSNGNVHASIEHLKALLGLAAQEGITNVKLHLFADGKDSAPHSLEKFLKEIPREKLATLTGRYYAMDRTQNWQATERAYQCMTDEKMPAIPNLESAIEANYKRGMSEEFLPPLRVMAEGAIKDNDALFFFNFREDSIRQLAESFIMKDFDKFSIKNFSNLFIATMTRYEARFPIPVAFPPETVENPLGKVLSDAGKTQLRLAETYKYAHVTYFFNGYEEPPFKNEYRVVIPSLTAPHPEEHPEMMASAITDRLLQALDERSFNFILVNYSNPDTMGHTGDFNAGVESVKIMDKEVERILKAGIHPDTAIIITADHGNVEQMLNPETGRAETQHDPNPVPVYLVAPEFKGRKFINWKNLNAEVTGVLSDIAPTVLELMGIPQPKEMSGKSLLGELV